MSTRLPALLALALLHAAVIGAVGGCADLQQAPVEEAACESGDDCPAGQQCTQGYCSVPSTTPRRLGFRLTPPNASTLQPQTVAPTEIDLSDELSIGLDPSVLVEGEVRLATNHSPPLRGLLKLRSADRADAPVQQAQVDPDGHFQVYLLPGRYHLTFLPEDENRPPMIWRDREFLLDTVIDLQVPRTVAEPLRGELHLAPGLGPMLRLELPQARVVGISRELGLTTTTGVTDERGEFELVALRDSGVYDLKIAPADPTLLLPEIVVERAFDCGPNECVSLLDEAALKLQIPLDFNPTGAREVVVPLRADGDVEVDWSGTSVTLRGDVGGGRLTVRSDDVDPQGRLQVEVLPGVYTAEIRPPVDAPVAPTRVEIDLSDSSGEIPPITLPPRVWVEGEVLDAQGRELGGARLEFATRTEADQDGLHEPITAVVGADGSFGVWLEELPYRLSIVPIEPALPRAIVELDGPHDSALGELTLPEPTVIFGAVYGTPGEANTMAMAEAAWKKVGSVAIEVFEERDGDRVVLGEGYTGESGDFRLILPATR